MKRVRIGIIGAGAVTEWTILPMLSGPEAVAPPDTGAWWGRRPLANSEIQYQAPARPEVVAISDTDGARAERVAASWRIRSSYNDWRRMMREVEMDALLCLMPPKATTEIISASSSSLRWLWVDGPPAPGASEARRLAESLVGRPPFVWCAHPLRHAAAHRAAKRLVERGNIGQISAITLRWGMPFYIPPHFNEVLGNRGGDNASQFASSYAALDSALSFASWQRGSGGQMTVSEWNGATNLWLRLEQGPTVTALFSGADNWSAPLPRIEVCGTQGRSVVCEAGRRLWVHEPREAARLLEPPGIASSVSSANIAGVSEDLKAFLAAVAGERTGAGNAAQKVAFSLFEAAQVLSCLETAGEALSSGLMADWHPQAVDGVLPEASEPFSGVVAENTLTLPL